MSNLWYVFGIGRSFWVFFGWF